MPNRVFHAPLRTVKPCKNRVRILKSKKLRHFALPHAAFNTLKTRKMKTFKFMLTQRLTKHASQRMRFVFEALWHFDVLPHLAFFIKYNTRKFGYRKKHAIRFAVDNNRGAIVRVYFKPCQKMITKNKKKEIMVLLFCVCASLSVGFPAVPTLMRGCVNSCSRV